MKNAISNLQHLEMTHIVIVIGATIAWQIRVKMKDPFWSTVLQ